jgi:hypothetical protein
MIHFYQKDLFFILIPINITISKTKWGNILKKYKFILILTFIVIFSMSAVYSQDSNYTNDPNTFIDFNNEISKTNEINVTSDYSDDKTYSNYNKDIVINKNNSNYTNTLKADGNDPYIGIHMKINASNVTKYFSGPERFIVNITDSLNNPIVNQSVKITINGITYTKNTDNNGLASLALNLNSGLYNVTSSASDITVKSTVTILSTINSSDLEKVFRNASQFSATFLNSEGKYLVKDTAVQFNINGVLYERKINENGSTKLNINLNPGKYIITTNNKVTKELSSNIVTVLPKIVENNNLVKYFKNDSQYIVKLIGDDGNPVGLGEKVIFNVNGVFYNRTSNESGYAKLNVNLAPGNYIITAEYDEFKVSNNIKVLPTISAKDLTMEYMDGHEFTAHVLDDTGKALANSKVKFNINGIIYTRTTDNEGNAHLNINIIVGSYTITSTNYKGLSVSNKIIITKPPLNPKNGISDLTPYLSDSKNCQVSNAEIVALAKQLTGSFSNPLDKATAIFEYVRDKISYSYYYDTYYGAVGTLHAGKGNCVDQAHLSIALYRAAGLPARYVHGTCQFNDGDFIGHVWSQVLIGDTWLVSDSINVRNSLGKVVNWNNYNYELHGFYSSLPF